MRFKPFAFMTTLLSNLLGDDSWMKTLDYPFEGNPLVVISQAGTITNNGTLDLAYDGQPVCILRKV